MLDKLILNYVARTYDNGGHSIFSPSGSHMWMTCPGSLLPNLLVTDQAGYEAAEGTVAHELHEEWLKTGIRPDHRIGEVVMQEGHEIEVTWDMLYYVRESVERLALLPGSQHIEKRVFFSQLTPIPRQSGTADFFACQPGKLTIRDYKHGKGVAVYAENNSQAMLYALGVFYKWDWLYDFEEIDIGIHQPRLDIFDYWTVSRSDLMKFASKVKRTAKAAWTINGNLQPSEKACRFCKVKANCPAFLAMAEAMTDEVFGDMFKVTAESAHEAMDTLRSGLFSPDFKAPELMSTDDMARIVPFRSVFEQWFAAMESELEGRAVQGAAIPGMKLVEGRANREFVGEREAVEVLQGIGIPWPLLYSTKFISPAQAEDMLRLRGMRKAEAVEFLAGVVRRNAGKPTLVSDTDKRPAYVAPDEGVFDDLQGS